LSEANALHLLIDRDNESVSSLGKIPSCFLGAMSPEYAVTHIKWRSPSSRLPILVICSSG
jgi:hypothetical protein